MIKGYECSRVATILENINCFSFYFLSQSYLKKADKLGNTFIVFSFSLST